MAWLLFLATARAGVTIVVDGSQTAERLGPVLVEELLALDGDLGPEDIDLQFADWEADRADQLLDAALADRDRELVVAAGPLVSARALALEPPGKPVVAALSLSEGPAPDGVTLMRLRTDLPEAAERLMHIIRSQSIGVALPAHLVEVIGVPLVVTASLDAPLPEVDGLLVGPLDALEPDVQAQLFARWTAAGIATLALGQPSIPPGAMGALGGDGPQGAARRIALTVVALRSGRTPTPSDVILRQGDLSLSVAVMEELGISPPFDVLADAELVGFEDSLPRIGMFDVIAEALERSPDLASTHEALLADDSAVATARANWLPSAEVEATASQLDPNLSSPFQSTTSVQGDLTVSQLLFSDQAVANVGVQADLRRSRESELDVAEQDLAYDVGSAFIGVLRARALIGVRDSDMQRARSSLEVARDRQRAGDAPVSEVTRWEAEVASARAALVGAWTDFRNGMVQLNVLRGADPDALFVPEPPELLGETLADKLDNPAALDRMAARIAALSLVRSPELGQLGAASAAQARLLRLSKRAYVMPTVAAQGGVTWNAYQSERESIEIPGMGALELGDTPKAYWTVGASASLPLFEGGSRRATQVEAGHDLASLNRQQEQVELAIRSRVRVAVNVAHGAAWRAKLRAEAADAATRSLRGALDAYAAGAASQVTVTEARTSALQLQLSATDATYEATQGVLDLLRAAAALPSLDEPEAPLRLRRDLEAALEAE